MRRSRKENEERMKGKNTTRESEKTEQLKALKNTHDPIIKPVFSFFC